MLKFLKKIQFDQTFFIIAGLIVGLLFGGVTMYKFIAARTQPKESYDEQVLLEIIQEVIETDPDRVDRIFDERDRGKQKDDTLEFLVLEISRKLYEEEGYVIRFEHALEAFKNEFKYWEQY